MTLRRWVAAAVLGQMLAVHADASERVVLRMGDVGADEDLLRQFADELTQACKAAPEPVGEDSCTVEARHLYVGRHDHIFEFDNDMFVAVDRPHLCAVGGCRLWMLGQIGDGEWRTLGVGAVSDFSVSVSDDPHFPMVLFGTYAGAKWEWERDAFQAFCISEQCMADFELESFGANAIVFPDPLSGAGD